MAINFPNSPNLNDTHTVNGRTWVWDGSAWKLSGTINNGISLEVSDTAPSTPIEGDMWYNSANGSTYTYYQSVWVELGNTAAVEAFISDDDGDTLVHVEEGTDDDTIRFDTAGVERLTISSSGHVLPSADVSYDLGSASYRFRDLYLSGSSIDLGGVSITSDGTNLALPPISNISGDFTVDTNTLHVDSTNNRVGIGTTSPEGPLHVEKALGTSANDTEILQRFKSDVGSNTSFLTISNIRESSGGSTWNSAHHRIQHRVDSSDMAYIDFNPESAERGLALGTNNVEKVTITSGGNVGIGTTSPAVKLHVDSGSTDQFAAPQIYVAPSGHASSDRAAIQLDDIQLLTDIAGDGTEDFSIYSNTAATHRLSIDGSGNVGIGTTSPTSELDITSTSDATINLNGGVDNTNNINFHAHDSGAFWHLSAPRSGDDAFRFYYYNGSAYTESLYQNTGGNIGAKGIYDLTTPATSSLVHSSTSSYQYRLFRSTSRRDAKTDIETITDDNALALLQSRPVWFRSALSHDDPTLSYYGFIAEELAEIDPRLCTWEAGRVLKEGDYASENERLCTCPDNENLVHTFDHEPECIQVAGVDYGRLTAHLTKIAQLQQSTIESQQTIISDLTARIEALESSP